MNQLKILLLATGYFKDNEYLTAYVELMHNFDISSSGHRELHHVIPAAVYKHQLSCKTTVEARKCADLDENNQTVSLMYKDHVLAHYFLYFCAKGKVKNSMAKAVVCMLGNLEVDSLDLTTFNYLPQQFDKIQQLIDHIIADPTNNFYTPYEIEFLKQHFVEKGPEYCAEHLNKPVSSVQSKANRLKLYRCNRRLWTDEEIAVITQYFEQYGPEYCQKLLKDRDKNAICGCARKLGLQCGRLWSDKETTFLIENYSKLGGKKCAEIINRPYHAIRNKASQLGLITGNPWSEKELSLLYQNYDKGAAYCATLINRSPAVIRVKANSLGLSEKRPDRWSTEELEFLKQNYVLHGVKFCETVLLGRTKQSITAQANKLGLKIKTRTKR